MNMNVSVVLPAHNEAQNLGPIVRDITQCLVGLHWEYEIIIVNDGSDDESELVLKDLEMDPRVKVLRNHVKSGYGNALRRGFAAATKNWIFFTDADRQFDIKDIIKLFSYAGDFDIVAGYRQNRQDHVIRKVNAAIFNWSIWILFGLWIKDIDCAFKLIKREVIERTQLESSGALINAELLVKARRMGYRIKEVPVSHYPRRYGIPSGANVSVIFLAMKELIVFRFTGHVRL